MVALALSHRHRILPPTVNWQHGDIDCDLDYIGGQPRRVAAAQDVAQRARASAEATSRSWHPARISLATHRFEPSST